MVPTVFNDICHVHFQINYCTKLCPLVNADTWIRWVGYYLSLSTIVFNTYVTFHDLTHALRNKVFKLIIDWTMSICIDADTLGSSNLG